jgi:hypothetical protein
VPESAHLPERNQRARDYVCFLVEARQGKYGWLDVYELYRERGLPFAQALVLVHPMWYEDAHEKNTCPIRGPRNFDHVVTVANSCEAHRFWGYNCPEDPGNRLVRDHYFPYSLGGPTSPENLLWLCELHNGMKGSDIHILNLASENFLWFDQILPRIEELM